MQLLTVVVLALAACARAAVKADIDKGVYVGTNANLHDLIKSSEYVLVEFCLYHAKEAPALSAAVICILKTQFRMLNKSRHMRHSAVC